VFQKNEILKDTVLQKQQASFEQLERHSYKSKTKKGKIK